MCIRVINSNGLSREMVFSENNYFIITSFCLSSAWWFCERRMLLHTHLHTFTPSLSLPYMHTHTHTYTHARSCSRTHSLSLSFALSFMYAHTHACTHTHTRARVRACTHKHIDMRCRHTETCIHMCTHIPPRTPSHWCTCASSPTSHSPRKKGGNETLKGLWRMRCIWHCNVRNVFEAWKDPHMDIICKRTDGTHTHATRMHARTHT